MKHILKLTKFNSLFTRPKILSFVFVAIVILYSYWGIWDIFFQQDEWLGVGGAFYRQETFGTLGSIEQIFNFQNKNESTRFLPIASILNYFVYNNIGLNFNVYGVLALILFSACALVLNLTIQKLTNSWLLSSLVAALWVTNNLAYQAFTWIGTMVPSLVSGLFFALSLYILLVFKDNRKNLYLVLSLLFITLSLLSKEYSYFYIFPYAAIIWFFFKDNIGIADKLKLTFFYLIPLLISLFLPRAIYLIYGQSNFAPSLGAAGNIDIIYNLFLLPAKSLFHIFFSSPKIHEFIYSVNRTIFENQVDGYVIARVVGDAFSLLVAFYILLFVAIVLCFANKENKKLIIFGVFSFFSSFAPFILFKNTAAILEPRFYLFSAIFSSLLLVSVINSLSVGLKPLTKTLTILMVLPFLWMNMAGVKTLLREDIRVGNYREGILETVSEVRPRMTNNNVFYFYTDITGFYEFQSGFGQTLAVWLYDTGKVPKEALIDRDLWDGIEILKQYPRGKYGYFMTYEKLVGALKENSEIKLTNVHSYYWDYQKHTVRNVSDEIRVKLASDLKK